MEITTHLGIVHCVFENLFLNPAPSTLEFYTSIQSELGDNDTQNIDYTIDCLTSNIDEIQAAFIYPNPATNHKF